jgi:ketosteroid isomerase-like protein
MIFGALRRIRCPAELVVLPRAAAVRLNQPRHVERSRSKPDRRRTMFLNSRKLVIGLAFGAVGCGAGASAQWDPRTSSSLRAEPEGLLRALDAGDARAMLAKMDDDPVVFDLDDYDHPVRYEGHARVAQYLGGLEWWMKTQGLRFQSTIARNECTATAAVGYCILDFNQTIHTGGQAIGPFRRRATIVLRKVGDDWRWTHWHASFRNPPTVEGETSAMAR